MNNMQGKNLEKGDYFSLYPSHTNNPLPSIMTLSSTCGFLADFCCDSVMFPMGKVEGHLQCFS